MEALARERQSFEPLPQPERPEFICDADVKSIAVFRALQLGDLLCAVPALRALRKAFPAAHVTLVGLPWARDFVRRFSGYLDDFVEFPGHPGLPERKVNEEAVVPFFLAMQGRKFDLAIQMHGSGPIVNDLVANFGARQQIAFTVSEADRRTKGMFVPWPDGDHEVRKFVRLLEATGIEPQGDELEFPLSQNDREEHLRLKADLGLRSPYICLHPGARMRSRRWLPERFAAVADALAARGCQVVITGSKDEAGLIGKVVAHMRSKPLIAAGRTSLGGLAALLSEAELLVCNDTGVSHVAAGLGTRSVVLTMGSDPARWAPLNSDLHVALHGPVACRPCAYDECPMGHPCAHLIEVSQVVAAAVELLERRVSCVRSAS